MLCFAAFKVNAQTTGDTTKNITADTIKKDQVVTVDTVKKSRNNLTSFIFPAALITYGVSSFVIHPVRQFDYYLNDKIEASDRNFHSNAETFFLFTPIVMVYGLNLAGVDGKNNFVDRTALLGLSAGFVGVSEDIVKHVSHRLRPNGEDYYSFPSGHTGLAFMGAEYLAEEYGDKSIAYPIIGYTFAVATGVFRMYNRDHWFSDVVAGAGFGILSTRGAYLLYPYIKKALTRTDKHGRKTTFVPTYQNGTAGLSFAMQL